MYIRVVVTKSLLEGGCSGRARSGSRKNPCEIVVAVKLLLRTWTVPLFHLQSIPYAATLVTAIDTSLLEEPRKR